MSKQLNISQLVKCYGNNDPAVQGFNLAVEEGEFIVLVGPSGCGKSTILRSIAGLETITSGSISLAGKDVTHLAPAKRDIAMVFQNYALYPHMSVYENLAYGLKNRGYNKADIEQRVQQAAAMLQITDYLPRKPKALSGGQRQRVAMGRAMVREPALFLFDEPLSNLDAKLRAHMRLEIKKLQKRLGVTSIYVTHDQVEAMTLADRIVVLNGGKVEQIGTPEEIYHNPASHFVASFMGTPAMNFLPVTALGNNVVRLPNAQELHLNNVPNNEHLLIGVRPEHIDLHGHQVKVEINLTEELGASRLIHCQVGEHPLTVATNEPITKFNAIAFNQYYWFDSKTGARLGDSQFIEEEAARA
ncbi:ABC transporter ATP-binding protein [Salinibius halmophilus]|uniref:ABC transporter ATP-binding protein n=1 Tax=Salinibius halmophilus TaxID=1853216 RepID=UPI0013141158|nr:sn-glycerol-3-phosphate ABC transporter ATP-binding protein UgpC [Salinibius halmophilus]